MAPGSPEDRLSRLIASLRPASPPPSPNDPTAHLASLVETAVLDGRRRAEAVEGKTAAAMQALIDWVERTDTTMREEIVGVATAQERASLAVREALALVTAKIDAIQQHSTAGSEQLGVVRRSLAAVETRLDLLDQQASEGPISPPLAATLADLEHRLTALANRIDAEQQAPAKAPEPDRIARIEDRLDEILARLADDGEGFAASGMPDATASALDRVRLELAGLTQKLETLSHPAPSPEFAQLRGDLADVVSAVRASSPRDALDSIRANVSAMADSMERLDTQPALDDLRRELSGKIDQLAEARPAPDLDSLRNSLGAVVAAVRANAPDAKLDDIRQDLREMRSEIAPLGGLAAQIARLGSLRAPDAEPAGSLRASGAEPAGSLDAIQDRLGQITSRLDGIGDGERIADRVNNVLGERIAALHGLVEAANGDILRRADLETLVESLAARLQEGQHSEAEFARRMLETIEEQLAGALRDNGKPAAQPADGVLEQRLSELANRIDEMSAGSPASGDLDDIRARLDSMQLMVGQMLRATPDLSGLEALIRELGQKFEGAQQADPARQPMSGQNMPGQQNSGTSAMTVAEKIAAAAAAAQTARTIAVDTGRRPGAPSTAATSFGTANPLAGDRVFEFGMPRPGATAPAARLPETPEAPAENSARANFIAAARKASQSASGGQSTGLGASEPEINDDTPRSDARPADQAPKSRIRRLLGAALIVLAIGGAILALPLVTGPSTPPSTQANRTMGQADTPASGQAGTGQSGTGQPATGMSQADQEPDTVGAIGPAGRSSPPVESLPPTPGLNDIVATLLPNKLLREAKAGNPAAEFEVGARLADGKGVPRDPKTAAKFWTRAAMRGLAPAQYRLGTAYEKGVGVPADIAQAKHWYLRAAERGNVRAMHNLGVLIAEGNGGEPDYAGAAQWFRKAADLGVRDSQYNLAILTGARPRRAAEPARGLDAGSRWPPRRATRTPHEARRSRQPARRPDAGRRKPALDAFRPKPADTPPTTSPPRPAAGSDVAGDKPRDTRSRTDAWLTQPPQTRMADTSGVDAAGRCAA